MGRKSLLTSPSPKSKIQAPNPQESNSKRGNWTQGCQVIQGGQKEAEHGVVHIKDPFKESSNSD